MKLFVGCSSNSDIPNEYMNDCNKFLEELFKLDNDLVFGACSEGLMGLSYRIALNNHRQVIGICPLVYKQDLEVLNISEENCELTKSISERTDKVIARSDILLFLPGGIGTIYELFTAIEAKRNHEFDKPIIIYNSCGYFDKLFSFLEVMYSESFTSRKVENCYYVCNSAKDALAYIDSYYYGKGGVSRKKKSNG